MYKLGAHFCAFSSSMSPDVSNMNRNSHSRHIFVMCVAKEILHTFRTMLVVHVRAKFDSTAVILELF